MALNIKKIHIPIVKNKKINHIFISICCFTVLILSIIAIPYTAKAQITKTTRIELNDNQSKIPISSRIYITPDPEKKLTYQVIISRHQNNLRGKRKETDLINLGLNASPVWMVFSVTNNSSHEDWILHFGDVFDGRNAMAHKLFVRNYTRNETFIRALREDKKENAFGKELQGAALPIKITKGQTELIILYLEAEGGLPNTITPFLMTPQAHVKMLRSGRILFKLALIFFIGMSGFFIAVSYLKESPQYLSFLAYYLISVCLLLALNTHFFATLSLSGEILTILYAAGTLTGLIITKLFLNITIENHTEDMTLLASGIVIIFSNLFNIILFDESSILDDLLIFLPTTFAMIAIVSVSFLQGQIGKPGGHYFASAWLSLLIGNSITALSAANIITPSAITINAYWLAFIPQAFFFITGTHKSLQMDEQEKFYLKSRENQAAQSLERLQQSKESADQARLLRVIERERELMAELREREMLRAEEMRMAKETADEANRAKSAFLAVVSHEIRTPMTGILGMVRLLGNTKLSKEQTDYTQAIQNSSDTMMALLNDILDFEKIESGHLELEQINFDMPKLVLGVVTLMSGHAEEKGISLKSEISKDFPRYLIGDPTRLRQILLNLVNNAIKFTKEGGVTIHLHAIKLEEQKDVIKEDYEIYLGVEDTGVGISEDVQNNLFNPFSQAEKSTTRKYGGTGLGLAICKRLTEAMGSSLAVTSEIGKGSTFFFSTLMNQGHTETLEENKTTLDANSQITPTKILVIEDNEMNRKVIQGFLENDGHHVTLAESGERALEIIKDEVFEVIFTDINLPGMSGIEVAKTIRIITDKNIAKTPIIALTGNVSLYDVQRYYKAGMNGFIAKPIDPEQLVETLNKVHNDNLDNPVSLPNTPNIEGINNMDEIKPVSKSTYEQKTDSSEEEISPPFESDQSDIESNQSDASNIFDKNMLQNLLDSLGREQFNDLLKSFISTADEIISTIEKLKETENINNIQYRGHELKGMAANFGFIELSNIAKNIEQAARDNNLETAVIEIEKLPDANQRAKEAIETWIN